MKANAANILKELAKKDRTPTHAGVTMIDGEITGIYTMRAKDEKEARAKLITQLAAEMECAEEEVEMGSLDILITTSTPFRIK